MSRLTVNLKKNYDDYYLHNGDTVYTRGLKSRSEYVSPYKEDLYHPNTNVSRMQVYDKLGRIEDLMQKYEIEDLVELEKALDQYYHRYDNIQTRRVDSNE